VLILSVQEVEPSGTAATDCYNSACPFISIKPIKITKSYLLQFVAYK